MVDAAEDAVLLDLYLLERARRGVALNEAGAAGEESSVPAEGPPKPNRRLRPPRGRAEVDWRRRARPAASLAVRESASLAVRESACASVTGSHERTQRLFADPSSPARPNAEPAPRCPSRQVGGRAARSRRRRARPTTALPSRATTWRAPRACRSARRRSRPPPRPPNLHAYFIAARACPGRRCRRSARFCRAR